MTAEEKCNRCKEFGPNGLTSFPCRRVPSRNCPAFNKMSEKQFNKIRAARIKAMKKPMGNGDLMDKVKRERAEEYLKNSTYQLNLKK